MYLHVGNEKMVKDKTIVGIFDLDTTTVSKVTRNYLNKAEKKGQVINVTNELPKSFIICSENKKQTVYLSQLNTQTLNKRKGNL